MKFKKIYIEITNTCNLSCHFCIQNQRKAKMMTIDEFKHIINEIKEYTNYVYLHVLGEPLLHPLLEELLDICNESNIYVNLTTNGTLLNKHCSKLIERKVRQVNVSLHNFEEHKKIDQIDYLKEICECAKQLAKNGTYVSLRLWNMKNNQIDDETRRIYEFVLNYFNLTFYEENIKAHKSITCTDNVFLQFEEQFRWPSLNAPFISEKGSCLGAKNMLGILCDGTIIPCCLDSKGDISLGNIFSQSLSEVLSSRRFKEMLDGLHSNILVEELCQKCGYRTRFDNEYKK